MRGALCLAFLAYVTSCAATSSHAALSPVSSTQPLVAVYTMGPGVSLFERFGHAAICLHGADARRDRCYNYGTADFDSPVPLTWGFLRGRALFWVDVATPAEMLAAYREADRTVWRQTLPLDEAQVRTITARLEHDAKPENRFYVYRVFADNCATKIRDIVDEATAGGLRGARRERGSFRALVRPGFAEERWLLVALDLLGGRRADREATTWDAMFLPQILRAEIARRFRAPATVIYQRKGRAVASEPPATWNCWLLFAIALAAPIVAVRALRPSDLAERLALALPAIGLTAAALAIWGLVAVAVPPELWQNELALLFWPSDLALPFLGPSARRGYARVRLVAAALVATAHLVGLLVQPIWWPLALVVVPFAALLVRPHLREDLD